MNFIVAIDSYKGSLTSYEAGCAVRNGLLTICPQAQVNVLPVSDGGDGMLDAAAKAFDGELISLASRDPMMRRITAHYAMAGDLAVIEVAKTLGLMLLQPDELNPLVATSYGLGLMIVDALRHGAKRFLVGLGGTATCDGGIGMLRALIDELGKGINVDSFDDIRRRFFNNVTIHLASDVSNPLLGRNGAAYVFAPQKGATPEQVDIIERRLTEFAHKSALHSGCDFSMSAGAGAAGGLGYAFMQFLGAKCVSGAEYLLDSIHFNDMVAVADVIITGEGHSDQQTLMGKLPFDVLHRCLRFGKPVVLVSGGISDEEELREAGFDKIITTADPLRPLCENMQKSVAQENIVKSITSHPQYFK